MQVATPAHAMYHHRTQLGVPVDGSGLIAVDEMPVVATHYMASPTSRDQFLGE